MKPGEQHTIACIGNKIDTMTVMLDTDDLLRIDIANNNDEAHTYHYLNHDTARQLFALLGNYLHSWPAP